MGRKMKRDFRERKIHERTLEQTQDYGREEGSKLKHSDDYREKIKHSHERFQDKVREKESKLIHESVQTKSSKNKRFKGKIDEEIQQWESQQSGFSPDEKTSFEREKNDYLEVYDEKERAKPIRSKRNVKREQDTNAPETTRQVPQREESESYDEKQQAKRKRAKRYAKREQEENAPETTGQTPQRTESEIYDPLAKDMDNDGIIDRYDNDFRDSDVSYQEADRKVLRKQEIHKKKSYKRRNYSVDFNQSKPVQAVVTKPPNIPLDVYEESDAFIQKKRIKQSKLYAKQGKKLAVTGVTALSLANGMDVAKEYLRKGEDDNQGVEAAEKGLSANSKLVHGLKDYQDKRKLKAQKKISQIDHQIRKRKSKLEFRDALHETKKMDASQKLSVYKKYQKRRQMKSVIYKKHKTRLRDRIKESLLSVAKSSKEFIRTRAKRLGIILFGLFILLSFVMHSCSMLGGLNGATGLISGTSYLASDKEITVSDVLFSEYETDLTVAIQNVPKSHPGYDSYRYQIGRIGHDPHELIAYLTAKYGEYSFPEVEGEIKSIFDEAYHLSFEVETETYTNSEGDTVTRRILITKLESKKLGDVLISRLNEEQQAHYKVLMETKGNFMNLHSPIKGDWKTKLTSMYGYRADPFTSEKSFHTGIDIADGQGTPLLAVFDGTITKVANDPDGYGNYVELTDKHGNMARYAHCSGVDVSVGQVVKEGDPIAIMGSTGRSTGSHLHFELYLEDGTRVNPYFYLYSESAFNTYTSPKTSSFDSFDWQGGTVQETVWGYLITHGYTPQAAAGIMGNIEAESGFRTDAVENSVTNPGEGIGLIQWSFGRKAQLIAFANAQGKHWSDIGVQIAYLDYEMNGAEGQVFPGGVEAFKRLTNIDEATSQFCWLFERPNAHYAHYDRRISAARAYYEMYKDFDPSQVTP